MGPSPVLALLLADSRFPAGTYAHSLGLEPAVTAGLTAAGVPAFMAARLRLVAEPEARLAVAARRAAVAGALEAVEAVAAEHAARCPSHVQREQARRLGAQLLRSAAAVWPAAGLDERAAPRPVALGLVAAAAGLDDEQLARVALYEDAATVASAALKLLPLDPAVATRRLAGLAPAIAAGAARVAADRRPLAEQPSPAAPALETAAGLHVNREERLFVS